MNKQPLTISIPTPTSTDDLERLSIELGSQLTLAGISFVISYSHNDIGINTLIGGRDDDIPPLIFEARKRAIENDPFGFNAEIKLPKELERPEEEDPFFQVEQDRQKLSREVTACLNICKMIGLSSLIDPHDYTTHRIYVDALQSQGISHSDLEEALPEIAALERFPTPHDLIKVATPYKRRRKEEGVCLQHRKYVL